MPPEPRSRVRTSSKPALDLPPPFRLVTLREVGDAFAHATSVAAEEGAGTLVYVGRFDLVEFAVVLEPEEPLRTARRALYAGLAALADALAVHAPPERPIFVDQFRDTIPDYDLRHAVPGGMTGWAQVHGWRGRTSLRKRIQYDLDYIQRWSFLLDFRILLMTIQHVAWGKTTWVNPKRSGGQ